MIRTLNPTEEHYLKRELLKYQLDREFAALNDQYALRKFGFPLTSDDPKAKTSSVKRALKHAKGTISPRSSTNKSPLEEKSDNASVALQVETEFPMLSYVLQRFVIPFPLLSKDLASDESFWQRKVQVFFEHFMELGFSDSYNREESTKRKKISTKLSKALLLLFNSGIGTSQETEYYSQDKFMLKQNEAKKSTAIEQFTMPSRENLQYLMANEPIFIGGWDLNIIAVVHETDLFPERKKITSPKSTPLSPRWMKSTFSMASSSAALFSKLNIMDSGDSTKSSKNPHYFILKASRETEPTQQYYTAKNYDDFKQLSHSLKTDFPGKRLARLPYRTKKSVQAVATSDVPCTPKERIISTFPDDSTQDNSTEGVDKTNSAENSDEDEDTEAMEEFHDAREFRDSKLVCERMRTSLRQYLRTLCSDKEIASSSILWKFFTASPIKYDMLSREIREDITQRNLVDVRNLEIQVKFQKLALEKSLKLQESMKEFKTSLLRDEGYLLSLMQELKVKTRMRDLSPLLLSFVEWCKIYVSSTIYQMFLGNDGGYELFNQVRKLHRLMPYAVMGQILKLTNPMGIMKAMIDLFMAQPFGSQSLLQTMFATVLSDDLRNQEKVIQELEAKIIEVSALNAEIIKCLKAVIFENDDGGVLDMESAQEESETTKTPISLVILLRKAESGSISHEVVGEVIESYSVWKSRQNSFDEEHPDGSNDGGALFSRIKELLHLYIRERDKRLMKKLWQDPELSQLLKSIMTLLYEPMVRIFKVARVDIALRNFEKFMNDLIKLIDSVLEGQLGASTRFNVVESINDLVTKHEDSFLEFIHDVYVHDTEGIFEGFVTWIVDVVKFLQQSKYGPAESRIDFDCLLQSSDIDISLLIKQLDNVIEKKQIARKAYSKLLDKKRKKDDIKINRHASKVLEQKWKQLNSFVMPSNTETLGLQDGDLVDLDLDVADYGALFDENEDDLEKEYQTLLNKKVDESEIMKFGAQVFEGELRKMLSSAHV
ncbi:hypothetical protein HG537_0B01730 [Torulaspora globosa]|uniref:PX domain-containing protein n=1 Tax=Torulaspora globosa TaxID=48254 RepID=A0A7H9HR51_9SACH|nr:hypothetical protein HG537_0B01730 [Torulaspora sp. CBS 2947]